MKFIGLNMDMWGFFKMNWKYFYLKNQKTGTDSYCVNSYGALSKLTLKLYEPVWLKYDEIIGTFNLKTKEERYSLCDKLFNEKFPQLEKDKKELSKPEQSKLKKLFP